MNGDKSEYIGKYSTIAVVNFFWRSYREDLIFKNAICVKKL